jgi:hypothetical protein
MLTGNPINELAPELRRGIGGSSLDPSRMSSDSLDPGFYRLRLLAQISMATTIAITTIMAIQ